MAGEELSKGQSTRLGERRIYVPVIGWRTQKPPPDLDIMMMGWWWMGYRLEKGQDNARDVQKCE